MKPADRWLVLAGTLVLVGAVLLVAASAGRPERAESLRVLGGTALVLAGCSIGCSIVVEMAPRRPRL